MIQPQPIAYPGTTWPRALTLAPYQALKTHQLAKVGLVALACFATFGIQFSISWSVAVTATLICSSITLISEAVFRNNGNENTIWGGIPLYPRKLMNEVAKRITIVPLVVGLSTALGIMPLQTVASAIISGNIKIILLASIVAPIAEEILFRGFIQERLEDLATLCDRYIYPLSDATKKSFSAVTQSLIFGAVHIIGNQVAKPSMKVIVFCGTSLFGLVMTLVKRRDKSLLSPIAIHSAHNSGFVLGLLVGSQVNKLLKPI